MYSLFGKYNIICLQRYPHIDEDQQGVTIDIFRLFSFTGDGSPAGKYRSFLNLTVTLVDEPLPKRAPVLLATSASKENYENLSSILQTVNDSIKEIQANGIVINGVLTRFEFYLGGDYKFLLTVLGMNSANAKFACIYCESDNGSYWKRGGGKRRATLNVGKYGVKRANLLDSIPLSNVVFCYLHLFLRTSDKILLIIRREIPEKHVAAFVEHLRNVITCRGKITAANGVVEFSCLDSADRRRILKELCEGDSLLKFIGEARGAQLRCFLSAYQKLIFSAKNCDDSATLDQMCGTFLQMFVALFQTSMVTPYLHILGHHCHEVAGRVGKIGTFEQQSEEKLNHIVTSTYFSSTNYKQAPRQIIFKRARVLNHILGNGSDVNR